MIIKSKTIFAKSGSSAIYNHIANKLDENEYIDILSGSRQNIDNCVSDAKNMNRTNSVIHFIISSDEAITREQALKCTTMLGNEFNFSDDDIMLMAEHGKERHNGTSDGKHWHFLVRANNPETGKTLNLSNAYKRQELVSRTFEIENNLNLVQGRHNKYVYHNIDEKYKEVIASLCEGDLPNSFAQDKTAQYAKREGRDLFSLKDEAKHIFAESSSWNEFKNKISERGWTIEKGTKKPDVLILNDENGKLIGSLSRVLGIKKDELNNIIEMADSIIASRVAGGTSPDLTTAGKGLHPVDPAPEKPQEAPEAHKATNQAIVQEQAPKADLGGPAVLSESVKGVATDSMNQAEKQAVHDENKRQQDLDESLKKQASEQKKFSDFLNEIADDVDKKIRNKKNFDEFIIHEIEKCDDIIDAKHPTLEHLDQKDIRNFLYKNFKSELDDIKQQKQKLISLKREIREHEKAGSVFKFFYHNRQIAKKSDIAEEGQKQLRNTVSFTVDKMKYKLGLINEKPVQSDYRTDKQKHKDIESMKRDEYKKLLLKYKSDVRGINAIAELKYMQREDKLQDFYDRPEVHDARAYIMKLERVRDLSIDDMVDVEKDKYNLYVEKCDIEGLSKLIYEKNNRILEEEKKKDKENSLSYDENNDEFVDDKEIEKNLYRKNKNTLSR